MAALVCSVVIIFITLTIEVIAVASKQSSVRLLMGGIPLNSSISVKGRDSVWMSRNGTFALGFSSVSPNKYVLGIWYAGISGDRTLVWMANRNNPVGEDGLLSLGVDGNLQLGDGESPVWTANTVGLGVQVGEMLESGNFVLYDTDLNIVWQSFASPTDTLLPGQQLTQSLNLTSWNSSSDESTGQYWLKMIQKPESLKLALNYNSPYDSFNYSYWAGPEISNVSGPVVASLDYSGSFSMSYGKSSNGVVYIYQNSNNLGGGGRVFWRITVGSDGNLRLYRWDASNGSRWNVDWAAVLSPCTIAGICGNGICTLDGKSKVQCSCPPGSHAVDSSRPSRGCLPSGPPPNCKVDDDDNKKSPGYRIANLSQTSYYGGSSVIANYTNISSISACGELCLADCLCVASVYGLSELKPYCWTLRSLYFGGLQDPSSTLFIKVSLSNFTLGNQRQNGSSSGSSAPHSNANVDRSREKIVVLACVLGTAFLVCLFTLFCSHNVFGRRNRQNLDASMWVPGTPVKFSFADLQFATNNFRQMLGTGGFGTVYKGSLSDGTLIAVKKLERLLPQGEREFKTEVTTIGAIHHMNLVRLCGFCSEGLHRLLVYEFLPNGSLDRWLFRSSGGDQKLLDWDTRYSVALGTAQGIAYFHEQCRDRIIHCDIKPENILLDENFCSKVSDFGLAKLMGREHSHVITMVRGTRGYLAPEWVTNRPITVKADVYSYGMVLLEIIGGRRNLDMSFGPDNFFFPGWAFQEMMKGNASKVADKRLSGKFNEIQLIRALRVAFWCIQDDVGLRPFMGLVVKMLEGSNEVTVPPIPQSVVEMMEEGLPNIYNNMKRDLLSNNSSSGTDGISLHSSNRVHSDATFDYSSVSIPR